MGWTFAFIYTFIYKLHMKTLELENDKAKSFFKDRYIWMLLIISLLVRIYLSFFTYVIKNDKLDKNTGFSNKVYCDHMKGKKIILAY